MSNENTTEPAVKLTTSPELSKLFEAMAASQAEMADAAKDSTNPFFKSKYADLASVRAACTPALSKHGLCVIQFPFSDGPHVVLVTILGHSSGQWIRGELVSTAKATDPQSIGSVITYLRRYCLSAVAGIAAEDDDGNAASKPEEQQGRQQARGKHDHQADKDKARQAQSGEENQDAAKPKADDVLTSLKKKLNKGIGCKNAAEADAVIRFVNNAEPGLSTLAEVAAKPGAAASTLNNINHAGLPPEQIYADAMAQAGIVKGEPVAVGDEVPY